jgi:hypothetical protein
MEVAITGLRVGGLLVFLWLHTANDPSDDEWDHAFELMSAMRRKEGLHFADVRVLIISDGGAPGGVQRARIARDFPFKSSVITTVLADPIKRGIATALSWINPRFYFGAPKDARRALEHLDLRDRWNALWPVFIEMQKQLPKIEALGLATDALKKSAS